MNTRNLISAFLISVLFSACSITDDAPGEPGPVSGDYSQGIFILNEGNFGSGNSSVSFLDPAREEISHQVYRAVNPGESLGDVGQSIGFYNEYAFVVMNASNRIVVVERNTFKKVAIIEQGLKNPRYIAFSQDRAFVTNWGDGMNPDDDFVAVYDAASFTFEKQIPVSEGPEKVVPGQEKLFVAHTGGFSFSNQLSVLDPDKMEVVTTIEVGDVPNSLVVAGDDLWVLSGGKPSYTGEETAGSLVKIDMATLEKSPELVFPSPSDHPAYLREEGNSFYYTIGKQVYRFHPEINVLPETSLFEMEQVIFLYSFEVQGNRFYAGSASADFNSNGKISIYDISGSLLGSFETGINPNGIFVNN